MAHREPLAITPPKTGVLAAESFHHRDFSMAFQRHGFHELFALIRGTMDVVISHSTAREERMELRPGQFLVVPAGRRHRLVDTVGSTLLLFCVDRELTELREERLKLWQELVGAADRPVSLPAGASRLLQETIREQLALQRHDPGAADRLRGVHHFDTLLLTLHAHRDRLTERSSRERVRRFIDELPGRAHEPWTLDRAAAETTLSRRRFSELFRKEARSSFLPSLQAMRLQRVCDLLLAGEQSIAGAAFSCGFEDLSHFYRLFRRRYGAPPGEWLDRQRPE